MSDLETRVSAALTAGVASPPTTVGLAAGARRRLRRRRRTRAVVGGALAVLLVGVPVGLLARDSSSSADETVVDGAVVDGWRTVTYDGVSIDVPDAWQRLDMSSCEWELVQLGPATADPCEQTEGVSFYGSATFDPSTGPGLRGRSGYVGAGDRVAYVTADPDVAWRVLASAREEGVTIPNLSYGSTVVAQGGLQVTVPVDQAGWSMRFADRPAPRFPEVLPAERGEGWVGRAGRAGESVLVEAPSQALAELITGSVTRAGADTGWRTVTWGDLALDVPAHWGEGDTCGSTGPPVVTRGEPVMCRGLEGYGVRLGPYPPAATLVVTDEMQRAEGPNWPAGSWWANVQVPGVDGVAILVTADRATGQRILDSLRVQPDRQ